MLGARVPVGSVLRAAIIGCGQIAGRYDEQTGPEEVRTHAKAYELHPDTKLVAVADRDSQRAREFSGRWGNPAVYADVAQMLAAKGPNIVSVCTPDNTHAALLEMCLNYPSIRAVWCEKPLTTDVGKAEAIVSAYRQRGVVLAVNYQRRWDTQMQRIKSALQRGELGTVQKVVVYYTKGICHNGSHVIDLLLDWFGPPAEMQVLGNHVDFAINDPTVDAHLLIGDVVVYLIGLDEREYSIFEIDILGALGRVKVKSFGRETEWFQRQPDPRLKGYHDLNSPGTVYQTELARVMAHALQEIVHAIFTGEPVRSNGESALATLRVCQQLATQARRKR